MANNSTALRYESGTTTFIAWQNMSANGSDLGNSSNVTNSSEIPTTESPDSPQHYQLWLQIIISLILIVLIAGTIVGNSLVCIAVGIVRRLRTPSNLLIVSLAVSDLLVGLMVMPFALPYEVLGAWLLGPTVCDMWTSLDVLLCTASILNLCMISVDRYFVITRPFQYAMKRTPKRMAIMITMVWVASALISIPPLFGWKSDQMLNQCVLSQELGYQIYATLGAFYLPLTIMIVVYYRIWRVSSRIAKQERKSSNIGNLDKQRPTENLLIPRPSKSSKGSVDSSFLPNGTLRNGGSDKDDDNHTLEILPKKSSTGRRFTIKQLLFKGSQQNKSAVSSKDRKATKTLGVIMGGFTLCWLPFFILAVLRPFCKPDAIPPWLSSIFLWLGYANSFLNPVIYARFNREFRTPFREILCCRCTRINVRLNTECYNDMYGKGAEHTMRDSLKPPKSTIVRYDSQGQTIVQLGNGSANSEGETKI
ncbi:histamine H2 receptor-like [Liolophura sinensis]|uniref:histamine H2 receptor-like n=1 Tax=Liolophura sinensis TaxID=3198878 RepID=UPI003158C3B3